MAGEVAESAGVVERGLLLSRTVSGGMCGMVWALRRFVFTDRILDFLWF